MFEIGTLVINDSGFYTYTNDRTLCIVKETDIMYEHDNDIKVKIIAGYELSHIGDEWNVESRHFKEITVEEYFDKFPNTCKISDFENVIASIIASKDEKESLKSSTAYPEPSEPFVLSDEMRKELLDEMMELYRTYDYDPTEKGVNAQIDEWAKNKGNLIKWMENHPNYNGKFQIAFDADFQRKIDKYAIVKFLDYLKELIPEEKIGPFTFADIDASRDKLIPYVRILRSYNFIKSINGYDGEYFLSEYRRFDNYYKTITSKFDIADNRAYNKEMYELRYKIKDIMGYLYYFRDLSHIADEEIAERFNYHFPELKATKGQKISRIVNKLCKQLGFDKDKNYNREFAKFSDAINPLTIKRHTVLSCYPVDYLTMSFGNSWSSCHTIDKKNKRDMPNSYQGQYSGGTLSYMLDGTTAVFYTVDAKYDGDKLELEPKINRCMFHIGEYKVVQGRVYPQTNDGEGGIYTEIRNIVQKIIADCWGKPNMWTLKKGIGHCCHVIKSEGVHYRDYENFDYCNVSYLKFDDSENLNNERITVGHNPICPKCGKEHTYEESVECYHCYDEDRNNEDTDDDDDDDDDEIYSEWTDTWMEAV